MAKPLVCRGKYSIVISICLLFFVIGSTYLWLGVRPLHRIIFSPSYNETSARFFHVSEEQHRNTNTGKLSISTTRTPPPRVRTATAIEKTSQLSLRITTINQKIRPTDTLSTIQQTEADISTEVKEGISLLEKYSQPCNGEDTKTAEDRYLQIKLTCISTSEQCYIWHWDVANWTIVYTNVNLFVINYSSSGRRFCPTPILGERTAKIVHADGKVEYHDCPNDRYPCAPWSLLAAHHDKKLNMRINTSPCCRKQVIESTQHMARVFDKYNITYFLVGGAVIGLARDGGAYIPYDTDLDVGVAASDYDKILKAFPELQKGYIFKWYDTINSKVKFDTKGRHWYMVGCVNTHCHTGPGIGLYTVQGDEVFAPAPPWTYPANITVPPIRRVFEGMEISFPKEPEKYLDFVYGKGKWTTPLDCTKHYYEQCAA